MQLESKKFNSHDQEAFFGCILTSAEESNMEPIKRQTCVCALLAAALTILGERIAAADTIQLVFDVQLDTLSNDVTGAISSVGPFSANGLTFFLNDAVIGNVVFVGGLE